MFGANIRTTFRDVAHADPAVFLDRPGSVKCVHRVHIEIGLSDHEPWTIVSCFIVFVAENMTHILAQKALDALPEFVETTDVFLHHRPWSGLVGRRRELGNLLD